MITETTISIALLSNFITWYFTPFDVVREWIVDKWVRLCVRLNTLWATKAVNIITCPKCLAFWGGLVYTQSIIQAILASMIAVFIKWMLEYVAKQ
jgi:hypothetical protein